MTTNTVNILPTFSMSGLIETEGTTCIQTLSYTTAGGTGNCAVHLWNPDGKKGTDHLRISRKAARPGAGIQGPQITFWEHSTLHLCVPDIFTSVWGNLAPSELKGLFPLVKFQLK